MNGYGWSYLTINRVWEFLLGILAYKFSKANNLNLIILYLFLITIMGILILNPDESISILLTALITSLMLTINANSKVSESFRRTFSILGTQGKATYSIYLMHWPIAVLLNETYGYENYYINVIAIAITWSLGWISYVAFEKFSIAKIKKAGLKSVLLIYQKSFIFLLAIMIYFVGSTSSYSSQVGAYYVLKVVNLFEKNFDPYVPLIFQGLARIEPLSKPDRCHHKSHMVGDDNFFKSCLQDNDVTKPNFYLIGDSHAMMLTDGLKSALQKINYNFIDS